MNCELDVVHTLGRASEPTGENISGRYKPLDVPATHTTGWFNRCFDHNTARMLLASCPVKKMFETVIKLILSCPTWILSPGLRDEKDDHIDEKSQLG
jgi:hypothetical protein